MKQHIVIIVGQHQYVFEKGEIEIPRVGDSIRHRGHTYTVCDVVHDFDFDGDTQNIYVNYD